uniref:Addiction module toxin, RelE/StbE family n=1 Tax=Candidatus Kentrum sp. DK TaxID=2126562 RepID=A0A450T041_9GAMM|nr:MAG: addiction module toxin, RelE/StbE family [Candidatus Kentron sp. DK]
MNRHLLWSAHAKRDMRMIFVYISKDNPIAAQNVLKRIHNTALMLQDNPDIGRVGQIPGTREFPVPGLSYLLPYRIGQDSIRILRVFHGARRPPDKW